MHRSGGTWRRIIAALSAAPACLLPASARAAELPDLEQVAPYNVQVVQRGDRWFLGFATAVRNAGAGALLLRGERLADGSMHVRQLSADGAQVLSPNAGVFRFVTAEGHNHWHYMDFMKYELRGLDPPGVLRDRKQGFCLSQARGWQDTWCGRDQPALTTIDLGLWPGGIDIYEPNVEGQEIEINPKTTPPGRYLLTSRIGITGVVQETRTDNNAASTVIDLRWPLYSGQPIAPVASCLGEGCAGTPPDATRRMTKAEARRLARRALRRSFGVRRARLSCRSHACEGRWRRGRWRYAGTVRLRYEAWGAATRWYYRVNAVKRAGRDGKARRIRHSEKFGGTLTAAAAARLCRLT